MFNCFLPRMLGAVCLLQGGKHETRCIVTRRMSISGSSGSAEAAKSGEELAKSAGNGLKGPAEKPRAVRGGVRQ
jgi:hypothetical protein